ncbi:peptidoglycan-associated lipoprotein Pal [Ancylobacter defluvii]|uniref:Peptidoglycan-associated lipoprotein n=1 Tax=Ancylobacter defluvii TaxID=1282440 RepID=A0A9W6JTS1_9HYPH|nr:peptidoglycan-associated lipoprotein Pal [Ancylobacter defluvii]MBS7587478.1 peptidoglycan-associated lipoprotein Pal [Ancylobacter defluvii]GLK82169.1 peptidoglycan-associated lipoprotein [Ancylobacter defluvii]
MIRMLRHIGGARVALVVGLAMLAAACAKNPMDGQGAGMGQLGSAPAGSPQEFIVSVGDRVFFESDQSDVSPQGRATLDKQAQWLAQYNRYTFTIEGHADERGTREYNIALGARRAQSVRDYLASRGIDGNRMRTISYGKERPVAVCNDISCWSQNRRAVTVLNATGS